MADQAPRVQTDKLLRHWLQQSCEHAVMLLDPEGRIIAWYGGAEMTFGYTAEEVLGKSFSMLFTPKGVEKGMDRYELDVAKAGTEADDDRWMVRKNGTRFWAAGVVTSIRGDDGRLLGFGKVLRDRTDVRTTMETITNENQHLRNADQRKNEFISTLAHELRNPLGAIVNSVQLLNTTGDWPEDAQLAFRTLAREAAAMRRLIDDLLDTTRVAAGKLELDMQLQELCPIVESAIEACRHTIDAGKQRLHVILPSSPLHVKVDADRLRQVFVNLISNAAAATRNGGNLWVMVSVEGKDAVVKVDDDGAGIAPDILPRIFDLFTQAEHAVDRAEAGLGIGLSVVKNLVQLHGGTVQVRSDGPAKGSEFSIRLPIAIPDAEK